MDAVESACDVADRAAVAAFAKHHEHVYGCEHSSREHHGLFIQRHAIGHFDCGHGFDNILDDVFLERLGYRRGNHDGQPYEEYASQLYFFGQAHEWNFEWSSRAAFGL
ncbi:hypothetical protein KC357_g6718 [Hortaea werneckii]|nr:hypothetical protein KC357_g6718 [Hortaea werneckii]